MLWNCSESQPSSVLYISPTAPWDMRVTIHTPYSAFMLLSMCSLRACGVGLCLRMHNRRKNHVFICFSIAGVGPVKQNARICRCLPHLEPATTTVRMLRRVCSCCSHEHWPSTIDACHKVSPKTSAILQTNCRLFTRVSLPHVVLVFDCLLTFSNMFPDLLQHFHHIDTVDTKMLASDWLL